MDTLLKLCSMKKQNGALQSQVKRLTQEPTNVCAAQKEGVIEMQDRKGSVAAKELPQKLVLALTKVLSRVKTSHAQELIVHRNKVDALKVHLISAQKKADETEYHWKGAKAPLQQFRSGQQRY